MSDKFTQFTFSFGAAPQQSSALPMSAPASRFVPTTLQTGLDQTALKNTAVLLLRGLLSQNLRKGLAPDHNSQKARCKFMHTLTQEIKLKKSGADPVYLLRDCLMRL